MKTSTIRFPIKAWIMLPVALLAILFFLDIVFFNKNAIRSRASGEPIQLYCDNLQASTPSNQYSTNIAIISNQTFNTQGYLFTLQFNPSVTQITSITYTLGVVSTSLGQDNNNLTTINQSGVIKIMGEIRQANGQTIQQSSTTLIPVITITSTSNSVPTFTINSTNPHYFVKINSDLTLSSLATNSGNCTSSGLNITSTPTPTITPTITLSPTPIIIITPTFTVTPQPTATITPLPTATNSPTPLPTTTSVPTPTITLSPSPLLTVITTCVCQSNNTCYSVCTFDKYTDVKYGNISGAMLCSMNNALFSSTPSQDEINGRCTSPTRTKGDADNDGVINYLDYYYYLRATNGGSLATWVDPDFNGDGEVGRSDRDIIVRTLNSL